jgi:hypothetical protein
VGVTVSPAEVGQEMLAARVSLVVSSATGPQVLGNGVIRATWTDDQALSTRWTDTADEMTLDTRSTRTGRKARVGGEPRQ